MRTRIKSVTAVNRLHAALAALWQRGASNAGYHYLGCGKTFALMGKDFAEAMVNFQNTRRQEKQ